MNAQRDELEPLDLTCRLLSRQGQGYCRLFAGAAGAAAAHTG